MHSCTTRAGPLQNRTLRTAPDAFVKTDLNLWSEKVSVSKWCVCVVHIGGLHLLQLALDLHAPGQLQLPPTRSGRTSTQSSCFPPPYLLHGIERHLHLQLFLSIAVGLALW